MTGRDSLKWRGPFGGFLMVLVIAAELVGWFLYGNGAAILIGAAGVMGVVAGWAGWSRPHSDACLEPLVIVDPDAKGEP